MAQSIQIILFGSWACGDAARRSDIDWFVICQCNLRLLDRIGKALNLLIDSPRAVDVIVYTPKELARCKHRPFIAQLLREGKALYEQEKDFKKPTDGINRQSIILTGNTFSGIQPLRW